MNLWPNLYFIGGMRCGSTTLYLLLLQQPEIFMSPIKEPMFWAAENMRRQGKDANPAYSGKHITSEAYLALFSEANSIRWRGEGSHYLYHGDVAGLLCDEVPDARIIVSLRNPSDRIFSEYLYWVRSQNFEGTFAQFLAKNGVKWSDEVGIYEAPKGSRLPKGLQAEKLAVWLDKFGQDQVYFMFFEDLEKNRLQWRKISTDGSA
jgi:hypothetical protein